MALQKSLKSFSRLFTADCTFDGVKTPEFYLKLSTKCLKEVQVMTSPRVSTKSPKFNSEQCKYLAAKLKVAVDNASSFLLEQFPTWLESEDMAKSLETYKLLFASAKQVQSFIHSCCKLDAHSIATVILPNGFEHISSLDFDLDLCSIVFSGSCKWKATQNTCSTLISIDTKTLLTSLKAMIQSSRPDDEECLLAAFLLRRLNRQIQGSSSESKIYEVDYGSLQQKEKVGSGGTCIVYKAIWSGAPVAMKMFIGPNHPIFKKEVAILAGLSHPNVLSLLCSSIDDRWCAIVTELMDEDLFSLIQTRKTLDCHCGTYDSGPFSDLESIHIILQIAEGVLYLHQKKIAHRDLKSNNILVKHVKETEVGVGYVHAKVADFGLSKTKQSSNTFSNNTPNVGTSRWMAPEMIRFVDRYTSNLTTLVYSSFKSDVYSFAMVCYEILTGYVPFSTINNLTEVKERILLGERPILPCQCPDKLKDLIEKCWSNEASTRPSFYDICTELRILKFSLARVEGEKQDKYPKPSKMRPANTLKAIHSQRSQRTPQRRLPFRNSVFYCNFTSIEEIQRVLLKAGLEDSTLTLIVGIDFSQSIDWKGQQSSPRRSLHAIGSERNPFEKALIILGRTLSAFDDEKLIPCFGFGDSTTSDKHVFSFNLDHRPCDGVQKALARYRTIAPHIHLAEPTSFAPVVNAAVDIVEESGGKHHVLVIISDGQVTRTPETADKQLSPQEHATMKAIVNASLYPLSIVLIGVGDGPWDMMREFVDNLPPRSFENFHFVNFTQLTQRNLPQLQNMADFALAAVMEIPRQYKAILDLGLLGNRLGKSPGVKPVLLPPKVLQRDSPRIIECPVCLVCTSYLCPLIAFNCTHQTCRQCASSLQYCPMCREAITARICLD